jgi:hypothetical protein
MKNNGVRRLFFCFGRKVGCSDQGRPIWPQVLAHQLARTVSKLSIIESRVVDLKGHGWIVNLWFVRFADLRMPNNRPCGIMRIPPSKFSLQADRSHSGLRSSSMGLVWDSNLDQLLSDLAWTPLTLFEHPSLILIRCGKISKATEQLPRPDKIKITIGIHLKTEDCFLELTATFQIEVVHFAMSGLPLQVEPISCWNFFQRIPKITETHRQKEFDEPSRY